MACLVVIDMPALISSLQDKQQRTFPFSAVASLSRTSRNLRKTWLALPSVIQEKKTEGTKK